MVDNYNLNSSVMNWVRSHSEILKQHTILVGGLLYGRNTESNRILEIRLNVKYSMFFFNLM